jgi:serine/threonine protein kinase
MRVATSLDELLIGRRIATRYEVIEAIGRGGMSMVYRAIDHRLGREVALKVIALPADLPQSDRYDLRAQLRREAAAAARIPPHVNVVQIYDFGTAAEVGLDFIAMELLRGCDLRTGLRRGLQNHTPRRILLEAARGLAAGHRVGVIHRDVKPANIFLVGDQNLEVVKILDFGIARALEIGDDPPAGSGTGPIPHSPNYTSPEQLDPCRPITPASDVFQLGLVAYELLAGERPFTPDERTLLRSGVPVPVAVRGGWGAVDPQLRAVIERALDVDPNRRFQTASEFAAAISVTEGGGESTVLLSGCATEARNGGRRPEEVAHPVRPRAPSPYAAYYEVVLILVVALIILIALATLVQRVRDGGDGGNQSEVEHAGPVLAAHLMPPAAGFLNPPQRHVAARDR